MALPRRMLRLPASPHVPRDWLAPPPLFAPAPVALTPLPAASRPRPAPLSTRENAAIVARNQGLEAVLSAAPPSADQGGERAGIRDWAWRRQISPGPDPGTQLISVEVIGEGGQVIAADKLLWSGR